MTNVVEYLLRTEHLLIMVAAWVTISTTHRIFPRLASNTVWVRLLPLVPIAFCSAVVWLPGLVEGPPAQRVLLGIVLGSFSGQAYKVLRQTLFGNDKRIRDRQKRL